MNILRDSHSKCWKLQRACGFFIILFALTAARPAWAEPPAINPPVKPGPATNLPPSKPTAGKVLTEAQLDALVTQWSDEKTGVKLEFEADFTVRKLTDEQKKRYAKSGKIPLKITCQLMEIKDANGKKLAKRMSGTAHMYVLDSNDKAVEHRSVSLDKMCPS
jgi:hypothetical protein